MARDRTTHPVPPFPRLLEGEPLPAALVDLDAVDANLAVLLARGDVPIRVATKSLRVPWLMRYLAEASPRIRGLMTYSAAETALLAEQGFDDLLLAYPIARPIDGEALARAAATARVTVVVDAPEHVTLLSDAATAAAVTLHACVDVDLSWRPAPGVHLGVRRSPIRTPEAAVALADRVRRAPGVELAGVMAYEAQVAGLPDRDPRAPWRALAIRGLKARSRRLAVDRRAAVLRALRDAGHPVGLVNGGGTGSVASTSGDPSVTEVTVGSGFLCPHLFDGYEGLPLTPAAFFALPVVRRSDPDHVTCAGGGYVASGAAGADRLPVVHWPPDLEPVALEGWGEVQTPLRVRGRPPDLGAPVVCRHAKAGELMERFPEVLVFRGDRVVTRAPSYRGLGCAFG